MAALEGHQADDPPLPAAREEAPQAGASYKSWSGLRGALEGREDLRLAGNFRRLLARHERYLCAFRALYLVAFIVISLRRISDRLGTIVS